MIPRDHGVRTLANNDSVSYMKIASIIVNNFINENIFLSRSAYSDKNM